MNGVARKENYYYSQTSDSGAVRRPPLRSQDMMAERNSRVLHGVPYESEEPLAPRKATKRTKRYYYEKDGRDYPKSQPSMSNHAHISLKEKILLIFVVFLIGLVLLISVLITAKCADIQNDINVTKANSAAVQKEIDSLNLKIEESKTINALEEKAQVEIGMQYPTTDNMVYLDKEEFTDEEKLAQEVEEDSGE